VVIPDGAVASYQAEATLGDWLRNGAFTVSACSRRSILLEASQVDFASVLLVEVENLLNHCFEHVQELACACSDQRQRSDAWVAVTAYYLGFFSASALLRLLGRPIAFIDRASLAALQRFVGAAQRPGQGAFEIIVGNPLSVTHREVSLAPSEKIHEATWKSTLRVLDTLRRNPAISKAADEADFYDSLCTNAFCASGVGFDWPSFVRNRTNYRPGCAYKLARNTVEAQKRLMRWRDVGTADVFSTVRALHRECTSSTAEFANHLGMMITVGVSLFVLLRSLYAELLARRKSDKRWERQRERYRKEMGIGEDEFSAVVATF
jgi:hypothetical protein